MIASFLPRLRLIGTVSVLMFAGCAAMAQVEEDAAPPAAESAPVEAPSATEAKPDAKPAGKKAGSAQKNGDKSKSDNKAEKPKSDSKSEGKKASAPKPSGGYATEAEASAHCKGSVVWVGDDHFNHYPGSREYGKKPGFYKCEN